MRDPNWGFGVRVPSASPTAPDIFEVIVLSVCHVGTQEANAGEPGVEG